MLQVMSSMNNPLTKSLLHYLVLEKLLRIITLSEAVIFILPVKVVSGLESFSQAIPGSTKETDYLIGFRIA